MAEEVYKQNPLPSHEVFVPPVNPIGTAVQDWARGFRERTLHPLETMAAKAKEVSNASLEETLPTMLGVGMMAGVGAKTANLAKLKMAEELKASGVADDLIREKTGWTFAFGGGKPMFEFSDDAALLNAEGLNQLDKPLKEVLHHSKLFEAYPHLKEMFVRGLPKAASGAGAQSPLGIKLGTGGMDEEKIHSTLLHEVQHAIQQYEKHPEGGTPLSVVKLPEYQHLMQKKWTQYLDEGLTSNMAHSKAQGEAALEIYQRLAGEQMAKATGARAKMTVAERVATPVEKSMSVPVWKQILGFDVGTAKPVQ